MERYKLPIWTPAARPGAHKVVSAGVLVFTVARLLRAQPGGAKARSLRLWHQTVQPQRRPGCQSFHGMGQRQASSWGRE